MTTFSCLDYADILQHLVGQEYSWVSSVFYFGYFFWEYPTTLLIARLPVAKYMAANTVFWGVVVALTAACTNYGGLITVRFLLGVAEATISPAFLFITSTWYTRKSHDGPQLKPALPNENQETRYPPGREFGLLGTRSAGFWQASSRTVWATLKTRCLPGGGCSSFWAS